MNKTCFLRRIVHIPGKAKVLTQKEITDIFRVLKTNRDRALFALGIYTGLRIAEIITLKYDQVFTAAGGVRNLLKVVRAKKKNTVYSEIPIHPNLRKRLETYHDELAAGKWIFPSGGSATGHLERVRAHYILRDAFDRLKLQDASTHSMRRTCLTTMSRAGIPLRTIQDISGHTSLSQLQEYLAVDPADKHKAINVIKY
jgi:integrase/recombinase XerD